MRFITLVAAAAGVLTTANASYDLMLLPRAGNSNVARFDPVNRVFLGNVGPEGGPQTSSVNLINNNVAAFTSAAGTTRYDISTGEDLGTVPFPVFLTALSPSGNFYMEIESGTAWRYSAGFAGLINFIPNSAVSLIPISDTRAVAFGVNAAGDLVASSLDFASGTQSSLQTLTAAAAFGGVVTIGTGFADVTSPSGGGSLYITYRANAGQDVLARYNFNNVGSLTFSASRNFTGFGAAPKAVVRGHSGVWVVGDDSATPTNTRIHRFNGAFNFAGSSVTSSVDTPSSRFMAANVVAPEPGTMTALALGAAALLRRKRKTQK